MMHGQERTFLKVFIEVDDNRSRSAEELKSDSPNLNGASYLNTPPKSSSKPKWVRNIPSISSFNKMNNCDMKYLFRL